MSGSIELYSSCDPRRFHGVDYHGGQSVPHSDSSLATRTCCSLVHDQSSARLPSISAASTTDGPMKIFFNL